MKIHYAIIVPNVPERKYAFTGDKVKESKTGIYSVRNLIEFCGVWLRGAGRLLKLRKPVNIISCDLITPFLTSAAHHIGGIIQKTQ